MKNTLLETRKPTLRQFRTKNLELHFSKSKTFLSARRDYKKRIKKVIQFPYEWKMTSRQN